MKASQTTANVSPDLNLPLLSHASVVLGKNSVAYKNSSVAALPGQLPPDKSCENVEDCNQIICNKDSAQLCSIPNFLTNEAHFSPSFV